jgi:hypothetical protein
MQVSELLRGKDRATPVTTLALKLVAGEDLGSRRLVVRSKPAGPKDVCGSGQ